MGLFGKIDHTKKANIWVLLIINFIPIICNYSVLRIKKFRIMFLINLSFDIAFWIGTILYLGSFNDFIKILEGPSDSQFFQISQIYNWVILPIVDAIFIWNWTKEYNKQIDQRHLTK